MLYVVKSYVCNSKNKILVYTRSGFKTTNYRILFKYSIDINIVLINVEFFDKSKISFKCVLIASITKLSISILLKK